MSNRLPSEGDVNPEDVSLDEVLDIYGCKDSILRYMVEPRGSTRAVSKDEDLTKDRIENVL